MSTFQFSESRSKHSIRYPGTVVSLHTLSDSSTPVVEIVFNGDVVSSMAFPMSPSGVAFAKRVYNGLQ